MLINYWRVANMKTIARVATPKRTAKVVEYEDACGGTMYRIEDGNRRREWRRYQNRNEAVKACLQMVCGEYLVKELFNEA